MRRFNHDGKWQRMGAAFALACVWACTPSLRAAALRQSMEPDYTKGGKLEGDLKYGALGPIGAFGNLWGTGAHDATRQTRMIQIREVQAGTPAAGVLQKDDVNFYRWYSNWNTTGSRLLQHCLPRKALHITVMRKLETDGDLTMRFFAANSLKLSRKGNV